MAITIQQYPQQLNMANSDLLWLVTSNSSSAAQYQYVCALKDGCGNTLTTIKQSPNPSGKGVFNLGRIVRQYLDYDTDALSIGTPGSLFNKQSKTAKFFTVAFGEEYGTSTSSSVTEYTGVGATPGTASYTGSLPYYYLINGVVDPNAGSFNWNTGSNFIYETTPSSATFNYNVALTDAPRTQYVKSADYHSISFLNGNLTEATASAQDITWVEYTFYSGSVAYDSASFDNTDLSGNFDNSGGPRTGSTQTWDEVTAIQPCTNNRGTQTSGSLLVHLGIGPQNLLDNGNVNGITGSWDYYTVKLYTQDSSSPGTFNPNGVWDSFTITRQTGNCDYPGARFAWINNYGVWDYFNFVLQEDKNTVVERGLYRQNFVDYSTTSNAVTYDRERRGNNAYYTNINANFTANSDWLTQAQADWLEGLFYSPNVYIQSGSVWLPVVITDTQFTSKTNPRTQKLFKYTINYILANNKRSR